ncbi:hypothetical protein EVA_14749 [gut metagenome]|uniref:Uncharacterized protein n=1 Tax=gut metagenome TaxID=749906 RepID=J9GCM7_9ZZZZ
MTSSVLAPPISTTKRRFSDFGRVCAQPLKTKRASS